MLPKIFPLPLTNLQKLLKLLEWFNNTGKSNHQLEAIMQIRESMVGVISQGVLEL